MSENDRRSWDERYADTSHLEFTPDPLLTAAFEEFVSPLFPDPGRALDVAGGAGRNALYLAQQGWDVTLMDFSTVGLAAARRRADQLCVSVATERCDLTEANLPRHRFELVLVFNYLDRKLFRQIASAVKPGGLLLYKTSLNIARKPPHGPTRPEHLLEANELLRVYNDLRVLHYHEHLAGKAVAELIARKSTELGPARRRPRRPYGAPIEEETGKEGEQ